MTFPTDEDPNPTDSGYDFARRAREVGFAQEQIVPPSEAVGRLAAGSKPSSVVFVDDFVGTGSQFGGTWERNYATESSGSQSFRSLYGDWPFPAYYVPLFCTELGRQALAVRCPDVALRPLHLLDERYSALNSKGIVWPDSLASSGPAFIEHWSDHAGIPDNGGKLPMDWRGFASLALTIAFGRFVPDATLPIFYWEENGWNPLIQRH